MRSSLLALVLGCTVALAGCSNNDLPVTPPEPQPVTIQDIAAANTRWQRAAISDYTTRVAVDCFCPPLGELETTVRGNRITRVVRVNTGEVQSSDLGWTGERLFEFLAGEAARGLPALRVRFDGATGLPLTIASGSLAADAGIVVTVTRFQVDRAR